MDNSLKPFWRRMFHFNWKFGLILLLLICIPRFLLVLHANATANYSFIGVIMFLSAIAPFIFLNKKGWKKIGIIKPKKINWLVYCFLLGLIFSFIIYFLGFSLYQYSYENWYMYIGKSYNISPDLTQDTKFGLFAIMAITGMLFSPIGEELFFRGIVHVSFANSLGNVKATIIDALAFSLVHLSHFGLVFIHNSWQFYIIPAIIWVILMFLMSVLFYLCKKYINSIYGSILCHSGFNLGMIYCIFYLLK